ncbi:PIN-like domain-containing protein, partial [Singulisphaera rosea]
ATATWSRGDGGDEPSQSASGPAEAKSTPAPKALTQVFLSDYPTVDGDRAISFHDLIELFVAGQLRDRGGSLQSLRRVHEQLRKDLETKHPFCRKEILTKEGQIFTLGLDENGQAEMIEILRHQRVFPEILRRIDYDEASAMARRWSIANLVVIDPAICLGKPIIEGVGIATAILSAAYEANDQDAELGRGLVQGPRETRHGRRGVRAKHGGMRFSFDRNISPFLARMADLLDRDHTARSYYDDDRSKPTTPDAEWIEVLGADDSPWVIVSGDGRILKNKTELSALKEAKLTFFCLSSQWIHMNFYKEQS